MKNGNLGYVNLQDIFSLISTLQMQQYKGIAMSEGNAVVSFELITLFDFRPLCIFNEFIETI